MRSRIKVELTMSSFMHSAKGCKTGKKTAKEADGASNGRTA